jgi:hypothetical protein
MEKEFSISNNEKKAFQEGLKEEDYLDLTEQLCKKCGEEKAVQGGLCGYCLDEMAHS